MNVSPTTDKPVENIVWPSNPPKGKYAVLVNHFKLHPNQPTESNYEVRCIYGNENRIFQGKIKPKQKVQVHQFEIF
jgi:hypothetical protein